MKVIKKAVLPQGFAANGTASGLKRSGKLDLALFYSVSPAKSACLFTTNTMVAAPILVDKAHLKKSKGFQAIIANSGNANCFTGKAGIKDADSMALAASKYLGIKKEAVLVASTGIIGRRMGTSKIKKALPGLAAGLSATGIHKAKLAIMTTDTFAKEITVEISLGGKPITICGIAKGAGMIAPNVATMLVFIFTDANITQGALNKALKQAVANSFNCITVDGCMSTNDSVMALANAMAGNKVIDSAGCFKEFSRALGIVCLELAKMMVKDGEGASKFIRIRVNQAKNFTEAKQVALNIANSNLFKTAMYGRNPNFGRIVTAIGSSGIKVKEDDLKIKVSSLEKRDIDVEVSLNRGKSGAVIYTSDLTPEYIKINAEYN